MDTPRLHRIPPEDSQLSTGIEASLQNLEFPRPLETQFREELFSRNLVRARISTLIYLLLLGVLTAINLAGGLISSQDELSPIIIIRASMLCPALAVILAATYVPVLRIHYQAVVTVAVLAAGTAVMWITSLAAVRGTPQFSQMGNVLVLVYGCLFLGLLFKQVLIVAVVLVAAFFVAGLGVGLAFGTVVFGGALLSATALMAVLSALRVERLLRRTFIETRLLNDAAHRDGLTGLFNRRSFEAMINKLWRQAKREREAIQFLLIDIDYFKDYNDRYGHQAGDDCLRRVARIIEAEANRPFDFCARYGGEEFALISYGQKKAHEQVLPEKLLAAVLAAKIPHAETPTGVVTISIGATFLSPESNRSLRGLIQTADEALYLAKSRGRNQIAYKETGELPDVTGSFSAAPQPD